MRMFYTNPVMSWGIVPAFQVLQYPLASPAAALPIHDLGTSSLLQHPGSAGTMLNDADSKVDEAAACRDSGPNGGAAVAVTAAAPMSCQSEPMDQLQLLAQVADTCSNSLGGSVDDSSRYIRVVDGVLPPDLLSHLQKGFAPGAAFWQEHNYGRVGYFSYMWAMVRFSEGMLLQAAFSCMTMIAPSILLCGLPSCQCIALTYGPV
jgi:hypothetical protein